MLELSDEVYEKGLKEYIENGINWMATRVDVINCDRGNVEQFASDSFFAGFNYAIKTLSDNLPTSNQQLKAEITSCIPELESYHATGRGDICSVINKLRQLSAV